MSLYINILHILCNSFYVFHNLKKKRLCLQQVHIYACYDAYSEEIQKLDGCDVWVSRSFSCTRANHMDIPSCHKSDGNRAYRVPYVSINKL